MPTLLQLCPLRLAFDAINATLDVQTLRYRYAVSPFSPFTAQRPNKKKPTRDFILKWVMGLAITRSRNHPSRCHRNRRRSLHPQESNS